MCGRMARATVQAIWGGELPPGFQPSYNLAPAVAIISPAVPGRVLDPHGYALGACAVLLGRSAKAVVADVQCSG